MENELAICVYERDPDEGNYSCIREQLIAEGMIIILSGSFDDIYYFLGIICPDLKI